MAQKGLLTKKNSNVVHKAVFAGNTSSGISKFKTWLENLNPSDTFAYEEYDDTHTSFTSAVIDETEKATVIFELNN